jgi:uncharacterized membrane protein
MASLLRSIGSRIKRFLAKHFSRIREINRKYAVPSVKTTGFTALALLMLRVYLFLLVGILFFKFFTLLHS